MSYQEKKFYLGEWLVDPSTNSISNEYYNKEDSTDRGIAEWIIAKQRNGPTCTVRMRWVASYTRFESLAPGEYEDFEDFG